MTKALARRSASPSEDVVRIVRRHRGEMAQAKGGGGVWYGHIESYGLVIADESGPSVLAKPRCARIEAAARAGAMALWAHRLGGKLIVTWHGAEASYEVDDSNPVETFLRARGAIVSRDASGSVRHVEGALGRVEVSEDGNIRFGRRGPSGGIIGEVRSPEGAAVLQGLGVMIDGFKRIRR